MPELVRPALPLLLLPLGGLWFGLYCAEHLSFGGTSPHPVLALLVGLALVLCGLAALLRLWHRVPARVLLSLALGVICGLSCGMAFWSSEGSKAREIARALEARPQDSRLLSIVDDPRQGAISPSSLATLTVEGIGSTRVRVFWERDQEPLALGTRLRAEVTYKALAPTQGFLHQKGVFGSVSLRHIEDQGFSA
ncbi:MAG: hypothetical protein LBH64_02545, partial [Coriobacteriales bacterium]|nr:hypothetical protein [Coriobacteriales bacterium]